MYGDRPLRFLDVIERYTALEGVALTTRSRRIMRPGNMSPSSLEGILS